ncbi:hypothetical protein Tco_1506544 [Tanacetum coccineum]
MEDDDQAIQSILLGLPEDIYAAVDSWETAQEIWLRVQHMMKGSDIGIQEKKAKLFNEWESFTSTDGNLKFLNNLQPEWSRHVTIVHQTKDLHTEYYTQLYDFLKYNQKEVIQNAVQNLGVQNVGNQNRVIVVPGIALQNGNGNVVAARAEGNANGNNADLDEIEEFNANCILMANLQQASISGTRTDKAPVYDSDRSAEVQPHEMCYNYEIFNMFTQEEQYIELLEPIPEPHQVPHNDSNVISEVSSVEQGEGAVEKHHVTVEETRVYQESSFLNLVAEVEKLSKEKSTVYSLLEEKKRLKSDFKIREDELLDKQVQMENKIKELDNILVKTAQQKQQSLYNGKVLLEKHDPPVVYDSEETLELAQESRLKIQLLNKEIKLANYTKINHLSGVFVSQTAMSCEELYLSNTFNMANVSKSISIPNEEFLDDTTPSVARKFLNEVKITIVTLQRVVKQKMTLDIHNWSYSAHQEIHKIVKDEIFPIVNQVNARVQNFEIQFLQEAAKFDRDFQSLANEADESLAMNKALELEI